MGDKVIYLVVPSDPFPGRIRQLAECYAKREVAEEACKLLEKMTDREYRTIELDTGVAQLERRFSLFAREQEDGEPRVYVVAIYRNGDCSIHRVSGENWLLPFVEDAFPPTTQGYAQEKGRVDMLVKANDPASALCRANTRRQWLLSTGIWSEEGDNGEEID